MAARSGHLRESSHDFNQRGSRLTRTAAKTGPGAMVLVAIEQDFPEGARITTDDLAYRILPVGFRAYVWLIGRFKDCLIRKSEEKVPVSVPGFRNLESLTKALCL